MAFTDSEKQFLKALKDQGVSREDAFDRLGKAKFRLESPTVSAITPLLQKAAAAIPTAEERQKTKAALRGAVGATVTALKEPPVISEDPGFIEKAAAGIKGGLQQLAGAPEKIGEAGTGFTGREQQIRELDAQERVIKGVGGSFDVISGGLQTAFAVPGAAISEIPLAGPVIETAFEKLAQGVGVFSGFINEKLGNAPDSPEAQILTQGFQIVKDLGLLFVAPKVGKKIVKPLIETVKKPVAAGLEAIKQPVAAAAKTAFETVAKPIRTATDFAVSQLTGLAPESLKAIKDLPKTFKKAQIKEITTESLGKDVFGAIQKRIKDVQETGKEFAKIRESDVVVKNPIGEINKTLVGKGFELTKTGLKEKGKLSTALSEADLKAVIKAHDLVKDAKSFSVNEVLNLRKKLDSLIDFKSDTTTQGQNIVKGIRRSIDDAAKAKVPGLKELDLKFSEEITFLKKIKKDFLNKDGTLKDTALSKIANLTNKNRELLLKRLEKLVPDIAEKIKALKAFEDVKIASGQKAGAYTRSILTGIGIGTLNLPVIAASILLNPKIAANVLRQFASKNATFKTKTNVILEKIQSDKGLVPGELKLLEKAVKSTDVISGALGQIGNE